MLIWTHVLSAWIKHHHEAPCVVGKSMNSYRHAAVSITSVELISCLQVPPFPSSSLNAATGTRRSRKCPHHLTGSQGMMGTITGSVEECDVVGLQLSLSDLEVPDGQWTPQTSHSTVLAPVWNQRGSCEGFIWSICWNRAQENKAPAAGWSQESQCVQTECCIHPRTISDERPVGVQNQHCHTVTTGQSSIRGENVETRHERHLWVEEGRRMKQWCCCTFILQECVMENINGLNKQADWWNQELVRSFWDVSVQLHWNGLFDMLHSSDSDWFSLPSYSHDAWYWIGWAVSGGTMNSWSQFLHTVTDSRFKFPQNRSYHTGNQTS